MKGAVLYKGVWLVPNSQAFKLHSEGKLKQLDEHMKMLDAKEDAALRRALPFKWQPPEPTGGA